MTNLARSRQARDCPSSIHLTHLAAYTPPGRATAAIALACQTFFFLLMSMTSPSARAEQQARTCPMLLMDFECAQRDQRLEHAANSEERGRIEHEYRQILKERRQACRYPDTHGRQGQWETLAQAGLSRH